jgi:hypothetical protein
MSIPPGGHGAAVIEAQGLTQMLPGSTGQHIHAYMPVSAGLLITQAHLQAGDLLSPWQGFGVMCLWTAVLLVAAGFSCRGATYETRGSRPRQPEGE